ncbi:hypothetical protein FISHEDRAFT_55115 [Fistulina hepatica ATCC 64428]|uniref:Uncharacterized protein n=1 Tax=Fistulina hepatica ATCC 64428 TaxID=1128425 RepID=A0A0D7ARN7_9AGAR|nr:hypothetical protein FISHEDRAFT_55115 [Fistulina hepatica ATCC 64428]
MAPRKDKTKAKEASAQAVKLRKKTTTSLTSTDDKTPSQLPASKLKATTTQLSSSSSSSTSSKATVVPTTQQRKPKPTKPQESMTLPARVEAFQRQQQSLAKTTSATAVSSTRQTSPSNLPRAKPVPSRLPRPVGIQSTYSSPTQPSRARTTLENVQTRSTVRSSNAPNDGRRSDTNKRIGILTHGH